MDGTRSPRLIALVGVGALLAFPGLAEAGPDKGKGGGKPDKAGEKRDDDRDKGGKKDQDKGSDRSAAEDSDGSGGEDSDGEGDAAVEPVEPKDEPVPAKGPGRSRGHVNVRGTVVAVDAAAGTVTVAVVRGNRHARPHVSREVVFDVKSARFAVTDRNGDGVLDVADLVEGDRVRVLARLTGADPLAASRVQADRSGKRAEPEPEPEPEPAPEPQPEADA